METTLLNTLEKLISDYNTKSLSPTWFRELSKTLLSKNISMEDWNTSQHYLKNLAAQNEALYEFCQSIVEIINNSKPKLKTIGGASLTGEGNIVEFENMYRFDGNGGDIGFGFTDEGQPCIKNRNENILCFTDTEYDDSYIYFEFPEEGGKVVVKNHNKNIENVQGIYCSGISKDYPSVRLGNMYDEVLLVTGGTDNFIGLSDCKGMDGGDYMNKLHYPHIGIDGTEYDWQLPAKNGEILVVDKENDEDLFVNGISSHINPETDYPIAFVRLATVSGEVSLASEDCTIMLTTPQAVGDADLGHKLYYPDNLLGEDSAYYEWHLPPQTGALRVSCADDVPLEQDEYGEYSSHAYLVEINKEGTYRLYLTRSEDYYDSRSTVTYTLDFIIDSCTFKNKVYKSSNIIMAYIQGYGVLFISATLIHSSDDESKYVLLLESASPYGSDLYMEINTFELFETPYMEYKGN